MTSPDNPLAIALFSEITMADQLVRARLANVLPRGMELSHFSLLNHLAYVGREKSPAQLARIFHLTKGAMTNTLGKLEAAGYIHITPDWDDARRKLVAINPAGIAARDDAMRAIAPVLDKIVNSVGPDKIKTVLPIMRTLRDRLEESD